MNRRNIFNYIVGSIVSFGFVMSTATGLFAAPGQLPRKPLTCRDVSPRWQLCGSASRTRLVAGVGIRFNKIDPNGRIVESRSYANCSKLAADRTIPAKIRAKAAGPCKKTLRLAATEAAVQ